MGSYSYVAKHNSKVMKQADESQTRTPPSCNCEKTKKGDWGLQPGQGSIPGYSNLSAAWRQNPNLRGLGQKIEK